MSPRWCMILFGLMAGCETPPSTLLWPDGTWDRAYLVSLGGEGSYLTRGPYEVDERLDLPRADLENSYLITVDAEALQLLEPRFDVEGSALSFDLASSELRAEDCAEAGFWRQEGEEEEIERSISDLGTRGIVSVFQPDFTASRFAEIDEPETLSKLSVRYPVRRCLEAWSIEVSDFMSPGAIRPQLRTGVILQHLDEDTIVVAGLDGVYLIDRGASTASTLVVEGARNLFARWVDMSVKPGASPSLYEGLAIYETGLKESVLVEVEIDRIAGTLRLVGERYRAGEARALTTLALDERGGYVVAGLDAVLTSTSLAAPPEVQTSEGLQAVRLFETGRPTPRFVIGAVGEVLLGDPREGVSSLSSLNPIGQFHIYSFESVGLEGDDLIVASSAPRLYAWDGAKWKDVLVSPRLESSVCLSGRRCGRPEPASGGRIRRSLAALDAGGREVSVFGIERCSAVFVSSTSERCARALPFDGTAVQQIGDAENKSGLSASSRWQDRVVLAGPPDYLVEARLVRAP